MSADIKQQYLEQLLKFKARKEFSEDYLNKKELKKLLKELTIELGFDESIWKHRKKQATSNFVIFEMLDDETKLSMNMSSSINQQKEQHLLKAISLDPFNEKFLKRYVIEKRLVFNIEKEYQRRLLKLYDPSSTEFTNMQVELGLRPQDVSFDYFDEHMISKYVDALVFLKEEIQAEKTSSTQDELQQLSTAAGFDKSQLKELNEELEKMLVVVEKSADETFLYWKDIHKAYLVVDRLVDLAPLNPKVLYAAIYFYGNTLWRVCFNCLDVRSDGDKKGTFFETYLNNKKPKRSQLKSAALSAFERAEQLQERFESLPDEAFHQDEDDKWKARFVSMRNIHSARRMKNQTLNPAFVQAFMRSQKIAFDLQLAEVEFKQNNEKFGLLFGAGLYLACALICIFVLGSIHFLWTFVVVPALLTIGVVSLREKWWKRKKLSLNNPR